ncbi:MAG: hypothetical protein Q7J35_11610 [Candidatus Methanoperedens sp.]|nr:hypothetical protein [Candidatus Methanoperedens sp.]
MAIDYLISGIAISGISVTFGLFIVNPKATEKREESFLLAGFLFALCLTIANIPIGYQYYALLIFEIIAFVTLIIGSKYKKT